MPDICTQKGRGSGRITVKTVCGQCSFYDDRRKCCVIKVERAYASDTVLTSYVPRNHNDRTCALYQEAVPF